MLKANKAVVWPNGSTLPEVGHPLEIENHDFYLSVSIFYITFRMPIYFLGFEHSLGRSRSSMCFELHVAFRPGGRVFFQTAFTERKASIEEAAVIILILPGSSSAPLVRFVWVASNKFSVTLPSDI